MNRHSLRCYWAFGIEIHSYECVFFGCLLIFGVVTLELALNFPSLLFHHFPRNIPIISLIFTNFIGITITTPASISPVIRTFALFHFKMAPVPDPRFDGVKLSPLGPLLTIYMRGSFIVESGWSCPAYISSNTGRANQDCPQNKSKRWPYTSNGAEVIVRKNSTLR